MNPVDDALAGKQKEATVRNEKELVFWTAWKAGGQKPVQLDPLLDAYKPLIQRKANEYGGGLPMVPKEALEAEITKHVIGAFQTYDPNRGASLLTHVYNRIPKAKRFVVQHQNVAYIPEGQAFQIGAIQRAQSSLSEDFGRPPTHKELADHLGMPLKRLTTIQKAMVKDVPASALETDPFPKLGPRHQEVLSLLPSVLTAEEKRLFDHVYDPVAPITSTTDLAKKLSLNPSQVSRLKTSILNKIEKYT